MVELPGWIEALPVGFTLAGNDVSSQLLGRLPELIQERAAPGTRPGDEHWMIRWPRPHLSVRVFGEGIATDGAAALNYRPALARLLSKHSPSGVAVWGKGFEKHGVFLGTYDDAFCWWVKGQLVFSPTVVLALDVDIVLLADEQMHFSVVGSTPALMAELDKALGDESAIHEALGDFIDQLGIGFGEEDRAWAKKFLRRETGSQ